MARPDLPAAVTLRPWRSLHELGPAGFVLGLDPATALVVDDLPPALARMAGALRGRVVPMEFAERAQRRGVPAADAWTLLRVLFEAGELVDATDPHRDTARRAGAHAVVAGTGPITVAVVIGLVRAGIGVVRCRTEGLVTTADLGTGLVETDRGRPRLRAVADAAARLVPGARVTAPSPTPEADLVVLADEVPDPATVAALHVSGTPHLVAGLRDGVGVVGPYVLPGRSACLRCLDRHRAACDPGWPLLAAQLTGRRGAAGAGCVAATAALAAAQALAVLDAAGGAAPPATFEATLEFDPQAGTVVRRIWQPAAGCPCGAVPGDLPRATLRQG